MRLLWSLLVPLHCANFGSVGSFVIVSRNHHPAARIDSSLPHSPCVLLQCRRRRQVQWATNDDTEETSSLKFVGHTVFVSDPVPLPTGGGTQALLMDFFRNPQHRNHLLLGEGTAPSLNEETAEENELVEHVLPVVEPISSVAPELWDRWSQEAQRAGTKMPLPNKDELLLVKSSRIPFPLGMTIFVESIVGVKLLEDGYPEYQFTLVKDTIRPKGPRALVWVFNKLTGPDRETRKQTTHSFSTLKITESDKQEITFTSESRIEIHVNFPLTLLRLLPMSREKCNQQGSAAIQKSFEVKGAPSLHNFVQAYKDWLDH